MHTLLLVGLGGFSGALLRYSITLIVDLIPITFIASGAFSVLLVNNTGSFVAGMFVNKIADEMFRLIFITGFLGSFTTFSAFSKEGIKMFYDKNWLLLSGFILLNVVGSLIFYHLGHQLTK